MRLAFTPALWCLRWPPRGGSAQLRYNGGPQLDEIRYAVRIVQRLGLAG
jgi:hypothetical protein